MEQPFLPSPGLSVVDGQLRLAGMPARALAERYGTPLVVLLEDDIRANCREYRQRMAADVLAVCAELGLRPPVLCDEPGRSIIASAGVTLYTVQSVKQIPGVRNYVSVNGGMTDNPRYALYGSKHGVRAWLT